jgi:hypothetical protein
VRIRSRAAAGTALCASVAFLLAGCGGGGRPVPKIKTTVRAGVAPVPPSGQGAYFGALVDPKTQSLADFQQAIGRRLDITAVPFRDWNQTFPTPDDQSVLNSGATMLLTLQGGDTHEITSGRLNKTITARAQAIKNTHKPIFIRWQADMDEHAARHTVHSASAYISAWKHIRQLFREAGVENVAWVWCPTAGGFDGDSPAPSYYPGDDQVDWLCADAFPTADNSANSLSNVLKHFLDWTAHHPKPVMIGEFGVPRDFGPHRAGWIRSAAETLQNPQVKAAVYYDSQNSDDNYTLTGDAAAMSALREMATTPFFNPRNLLVASD